MGNGTALALEGLQTLYPEDSMACVVIVKTSTRQCEYVKPKKKESKEELHVESWLMAHILDRGVANIPDGSTIIFVANWSPCQACTRLVPDFLSALNFRTSNLRVKFKFKNYYAKPGVTTGLRDVWASEGEARAEYNRLTSQYAPTLVSLPEKHNGKPLFKVKDKLVFANQWHHTSSAVVWE